MATAHNLATLSTIPDGANILKLTLDVTLVLSIETALSQTLTRFGCIDILVNNTGYTLVGAVWPYALLLNPDKKRETSTAKHQNIQNRQ